MHKDDNLSEFEVKSELYFNQHDDTDSSDSDTDSYTAPPIRTPRFTASLKLVFSREKETDPTVVHKIRQNVSMFLQHEFDGTSEDAGLGAD